MYLLNCNIHLPVYLYIIIVCPTFIEKTSHPELDDVFYQYERVNNSILIWIIFYEKDAGILHL